MDTREYIDLLVAGTRNLTLESGIETARRWMNIRYQQTGESFAKEYNDILNQADIDGHFEKFFTDSVVTPFYGNLPPEMRDPAQIPIAILPTRVVNAHTFRAPNGDPIIVIDEGLVTMTYYYMEARVTHKLLSLKFQEPLRGPIMTNYLMQTYSFILEYFARGGMFDYPTEVMELNTHQLGLVLAMTIGIEVFVLAHELAHVYAGHIGKSTTKNVVINPKDEISADCYQLSWEQEFEADKIAWQLYQATWRKLRLVKLVEPDGAILPLHFFCLIALVEKNLFVSDKFSTHPPAIERANRLIAMIDKSDLKLTDLAHNTVDSLKVMPDKASIRKVMDDYKEFVVYSYDNEVQELLTMTALYLGKLYDQRGLWWEELEKLRIRAGAKGQYQLAIFIDILRHLVKGADLHRLTGKVPREFLYAWKKLILVLQA